MMTLSLGLRRSLPRLYSTTVKSYFGLFPQNFPHGGPPADSFHVQPKALRREYKLLQSNNHPDILGLSLHNDGLPSIDEGTADVSTVINRAYTVLRNPYTRIAHLIQLYHPEQLDITQDDEAKKFIASFQESSPERSVEYKSVLMTVLEAHESLELAEDEGELEELSVENDERINESEDLIERILKTEWPVKNWNDLIIEGIQLKYWVNIQNGIKEWEPGKPVHLTH